MNNDLTCLLAACLDKLDQNAMTLDEVLELHPEARDELEPLLRTACLLQENPFIVRPEFKQNSPARIQSKLPYANKKPSRQSTFQNLRNFPNRMVWGLAILLGLIFVSLLGSGTVYASGSSLPGDLMYPVKLAIEDARLFVADDEKDLQLQMEFLQTRLNEIDRLIIEDRSEDLLLAGKSYLETLNNAAAVLEKNKTHDNSADNIEEYQDYLSKQTEIISELIDSVPSQAQPALQNILDKTKKNQEPVDNPEIKPQIPEKTKNNPAKSQATITPVESIIELTETPEPTEKTNNGKNEENDPEVKSTSIVTHGPPEKEKTKNPKVPTKKTK